MARTQGDTKWRGDCKEQLQKRGAGVAISGALSRATMFLKTARVRVSLLMAGPGPP